MSLVTGKISGINSNLLTVVVDGTITQNEVGYAIKGEERLKSEVIRIQGNKAFLQVFESTKGLKVGDTVEFTGELLSVQLGPGLLQQIYDGLQNPLPQLAEKHGFFLPRGQILEALDSSVKWEFTPSVKVGDKVSAGQYIGSVPETQFTHYIMVPFDVQGEWTVEEIVGKGDYTVVDKIATIKDQRGATQELKLQFNWPVKLPIQAYKQKLMPTDPLITKVRIIDTFFPVAKGGTYCVPGPFGAGKTVIQQITSRYADVDIVIIAACGERAGEVPRRRGFRRLALQAAQRIALPGSRHLAALVGDDFLEYPRRASHPFSFRPDSRRFTPPVNRPAKPAAAQRCMDY